MGTISRTSFNYLDIPPASAWNTQFNTMYDCINGNLSDANLKNNAITSPKITDGVVASAKIGLMDYYICFSYDLPIVLSAENIVQYMFPYDCTAKEIVIKSGKSASALTIDIGKADLNVSSIGSSFFAAGSAVISASSVTVSATGAALANTAITAGTKMIISVKNADSGNGGQPLLINMKVEF